MQGIKKKSTEIQKKPEKGSPQKSDRKQKRKQEMETENIMNRDRNEEVKTAGRETLQLPAIELGVQTKNVVEDDNPAAGFRRLKAAGFSCVDFSLNSYLDNISLYRSERNDFFDRSGQELEEYFRPHRLGAGEAGIRIHQMHMPYPVYIPNGKQELNEYLWKTVAPKSIAVCDYLDCRYLVVHGFKLSRNLGSEEAEWEWTERFLHSVAPMAKERGITLCVENLYSNAGGHLVEGPCCHARKAAERIDRFNEQYHVEVLGFCFDTGHANLVGLDFEKFITTLGSRLKVLHIHDNDGIGDLHQIPFTFTRTRENTSSTDWEGFVRGLRAIGFHQVLSFETAPVLNSFPGELKGEALSFIAQIGRWFSAQIAKPVTFSGGCERYCKKSSHSIF